MTKEIDIFSWLDPVCQTLIESGQRSLVQRLRYLPHHVVEDEHDVVDAQVPELLAAVQQLDNPWLEIFVRHWDLQSRILKRVDVANAMDDAVYLLDLASGEDTKDCPQSICAVQDLAAGYGFLDGQGYANERMAVASETLDRIDPRWPCYSCISGEYADALIDAGKPEEAFNFLESQDNNARRMGLDPLDVEELRFEALLCMGRLEEARQIAQKPARPLQGSHGRLCRSLNLARVLARLGDVEASQEALPDFLEEIRDTPVLYLDWLDAVQQLCERGGMVNDGQLDRKVAFIAEELNTRGVLRDAFDASRIRFELAVQRGQKYTATEALASMRQQLKRLDRPMDAPQKLLRAENTWANMEQDSADLGPTAEATLASLSEDPEIAWQQILAAHQAWPSAMLVLEAMVTQAWNTFSGLEALRRVELAVSDIELASSSGSTSPERTQEASNEARLRGLLGYLYQEFRSEQFQAWADDLIDRGGEFASVAHWQLGNKAYQDGELDKALAHYKHVLDEKPEARRTRCAVALIQEEQGKYEQAFLQLEEVVAGDEELDERLVWWRLMLATRLERWERVRELGGLLGMTFATETGEVEEAWHSMMLEYRAPLVVGAPERMHAVRTGPVTAVVTTIAHPSELMRFRERVLFDPTPLEEPSEDEDPVFRAVEVLTPSKMWSFHLTGATPETAALERLEGKLRELGGGIARVSEDWTLEAEGDPNSYNGFAWRIALPEDGELEHVEQAIRVAAEDVKGPLVWLGLLQRLGREKDLAEQREVALRWDMADDLPFVD